MMIIWIILSLIIVAADRTTKILAGIYFANETFEVIPGLFSFVYLKNTGAAFSMLEGRTWFLSVISIAFCVFVVAYGILKRPKNKLLCISGALIFSGALGNAIDRIFYGYVVDFIKTEFIDFPVFNIADIAITVGAALLMIYVLIFDSKEKKQ